MDYSELDERPRPAYINLAPEIIKNPITDSIEPHFPKQKRVRRMVASYVFILAMVSGWMSKLLCIFRSCPTYAWYY